MFDDFPLFPQAASSNAWQVDALYIFMVLLCGLMAFLVFALILYFALKYRRTPENEIPQEYEPPHGLETGLIGVWLAMFMVMFAWGSQLYFSNSRPPDDSLEVYATAKQWMWRFQHLGGQSEINELHVPLGRPVKVIFASEDVIHSFFVPDFRVKVDVLPNRYSTTWFKAIKTGRFHLYCAEYCGTQHSGMGGWVTVMEPSEYQTWVSGGTGEGSPVVQGKRLFERMACNTCHMEDNRGRGPVLIGFFGKPTQLTGGATVMVDENYIRESVLDPQAKIAEGYEPLMPTFKGQLNEVELIQLIAYIKSLTPPVSRGTAAPPVAAPAAVPDAAAPAAAPQVAAPAGAPQVAAPAAASETATPTNTIDGTGRP